MSFTGGVIEQNPQNYMFAVISVDIVGSLPGANDKEIGENVINL